MRIGFCQWQTFSASTQWFSVATHNTAMTSVIARSTHKNAKILLWFSIVCYAIRTASSSRHRPPFRPVYEAKKKRRRRRRSKTKYTGPPNLLWYARWKRNSPNTLCHIRDDCAPGAMERKESQRNRTKYTIKCICLIPYIIDKAENTHNNILSVPWCLMCDSIPFFILFWPFFSILFYWLCEAISMAGLFRWQS